MIQLTDERRAALFREAAVCLVKARAAREAGGEDLLLAGLAEDHLRTLGFFPEELRTTLRELRELQDLTPFVSAAKWWAWAKADGDHSKALCVRMVRSYLADARAGPEALGISEAELDRVARNCPVEGTMATAQAWVVTVVLPPPSVWARLRAGLGEWFLGLVARGSR